MGISHFEGKKSPPKIKQKKFWTVLPPVSLSWQCQSVSFIVQINQILNIFSENSLENIDIQKKRSKMKILKIS